MPSSWHAIQRHVLAKDAEIGDKNAITCLFWSEDFDDMPKPDLDPADCRIVAELQANGRLSNVELVGKLLNLPIVREVRSNIAIQTLKAGAPLPLEHFEMEQAQTPAQAAKHRRPERGGLRR